MTLYKWGKFKREEKYSEGYREVFKKRYPIPSNEYGYFEYIASWRNLSYGEKQMFYPGYEIKNGGFVRIGQGDFSGGYVILGSQSLVKNGDLRWINGAHYLFGDLYNLEYKKYFDGYSKGSRLDTVTSTNRNAYPDNGESGSYWYVYEGIANQEPTISGQDKDWGGYKQAFKRYYSVDDGDSDQQLNVVVTLNGVTIATVNNATRKTDYPIDIDDSKFNALTLNEQNTIEITVTDSSGATAVRRYTFKRINTAPVVTMTNAHYGEQNKPFTINFEAADPDGDEITAKLFIDDVQIKDLGTIKGKQSVIIPKIDFTKIPNGEHKIRVEAKDSYNAVGAGYADFSKNLTYAWYRLKKELSEQPSAVIVNPLSEVAPGAKMTIKVCSNVMDAQPTWETVPEELYGQKYNFRNTSKTAAKWGVGVEIRIDKEKATEESYLYGFVGAYM